MALMLIVRSIEDLQRATATGVGVTDCNQGPIADSGLMTIAEGDATGGDCASGELEMGATGGKGSAKRSQQGEWESPRGQTTNHQKKNLKIGTRGMSKYNKPKHVGHARERPITR
jgi:hypothetical protein